MDGRALMSEESGDAVSFTQLPKVAGSGISLCDSGMTMTLGLV